MKVKSPTTTLKDIERILGIDNEHVKRRMEKNCKDASIDRASAPQVVSGILEHVISAKNPKAGLVMSIVGPEFIDSAIADIPLLYEDLKAIKRGEHIEREYSWVAKQKRWAENFVGFLRRVLS